MILCSTVAKSVLVSFLRGKRGLDSIPMTSCRIASATGKGSSPNNVKSPVCWYRPPASVSLESLLLVDFMLWLRSPRLTIDVLVAAFSTTSPGDLHLGHSHSDWLHGESANDTMPSPNALL